ncbi:ABC transporter ATPase [Clostridium perfringens]|uniref:ABC transporter ATPase n=1 Tax=Clostridium perfringens TaxID=1502 RepID=UPI0039EBC298
MRKLETIQKKNNLNKVFAVDEKGNGGANHKYWIAASKYDGDEPSIFEVQFQNGARFEDGSIDGVLDCDLLEIVRDRLLGFQEGEYANGYNEAALYHVEKALKWLNKRVEDRDRRGVLGTNNK